MRFRRSVSILSGICALSLTLGRSINGCENTSGEALIGGSAATSEHVGMPMQSQGDGERQKPCKFSAVVCCQAMTSCGLAVGLARTVSTSNALSRENRLPARPFQIALNRITPPEPPPPKA